MLWYLKQLLPLRYETEYTEGGYRYREKWRMWFGRCFARNRTRIPTLDELLDLWREIQAVDPSRAGKITGLTA